MFFRKRPSFAENDLDSVIEACRNHDAQAQRVLFKKFYGYSKSICLRYSATTEEAEEVLNESFLKVFQRLHQYDATHPFKAWLRSILINTAISYYRKYHKLDMSSLEAGQDVPFEDDVIGQISADEILALVQQLPPAYRTVFSMHVVDGYSLREIAEVLQSNEATIRSHFLRSRQRLQQAIRSAYPHLFPSDPAIPIRYYEN
ncbi:RNA polymerase sigma factor [Larkinella sp. C7]|uniref:RNA polymerase sigma factor n=1 Tax=Larkinella sp. C7 TaxID=2576607 RepID=UPI0011110524|nr:RNA polymerase sigma factor [Larkinella sp. C7]